MIWCPAINSAPLAPEQGLEKKKKKFVTIFSNIPSNSATALSFLNVWTGLWKKIALPLKKH